MSRKTPRAPRGRQTGFSLVEMSVVLIIIALILGAVAIGKDMQRDAEYVKIKQKFIDAWAGAYNTYYLRAGVVLGDSQTAPNYMVNGAAYASGTPGSSGGNMTSATEPSAICDAAGTATSPLRAAIASLYDEMDKHGVRMPPGRAEGKEARYVYLDSNGNPQEIEVCFQWNKPGTDWNSGNVMVIKGLTPDLARSLDQMIDGKADASEGMFRQAGLAAASVGAPNQEWKANNTNQFAATGTVAAATAADRRDEDQVITVVAHYKMNQ